MIVSPIASQPAAVLAVGLPIPIFIGLLATAAICWLLMQGSDKDDPKGEPPVPSPPDDRASGPEPIEVPAPTPPLTLDTTATETPAEWPTAEKFAERLQASLASTPETPFANLANATSSAPQADDPAKVLPILYEDGLQILQDMPFFARDPGAYIEKHGMRPFERKFAWEKKVAATLEPEPLQKYRLQFQARIPPDASAGQRFISPDEELCREVEVRLTRLARTLGELYNLTVTPPPAQTTSKT